MRLWELAVGVEMKPGKLENKSKFLGGGGIFLDCLLFFSFWIVLHSVHGDSDMTHSASFLAFLPAMISQDFKGGDNWILSRCWVPPVRFKAGSRVSQKVGIDPGLDLAVMFCQKDTWVVSRNADTMTSLLWGALSVLILCVQHAHQEWLPGFVLKFNLSLPYTSLVAIRNLHDCQNPCSATCEIDEINAKVHGNW